MDALAKRDRQDFDRLKSIEYLHDDILQFIYETKKKKKTNYCIKMNAQWAIFKELDAIIR